MTTSSDAAHRVCYVTICATGAIINPASTCTTILSENLLHCLNDTRILLKQLKSILSASGKIYFTTLVRANRIADQYIKALANSGKLVSRSADDHNCAFEQAGLSIKCQTYGNILIIKGNK
jgi:hypothetical protein